MSILELLKRIEDGTEELCPECWAVCPSMSGHKPGCELKAAIEYEEMKKARIDQMEPDLKAFFIPSKSAGMK